MSDPPASLSQHAQFERYRSYLLLLARLQLDKRWQQRIDPSDLVQQTLLDGQAKWHQMGTENAELAAWLRKALSNNLADAIRKLQTAKRNIGRERLLNDALDASSAALASLLGQEQTSVGQRAVRNEDLVRLAEALAQLPEPQREAIVLHHLQGASLKETARSLGRTDPAVAGLLHRGLRRLRELMLSRAAD
ncbi:MAG: sigma-70 family RNA polymerase sigma factor [Planctomycetaceae bacterium]|nr:MAG: sigma-70 family RNA polymerase sigma factor [Planctomycetaceae bacterium]